MEARRQGGVGSGHVLVVVDVEQPGPALLTKGERDDAAELDKLRLREVLVQLRPQSVAVLLVPRDRLRMGKGGLLPAVVPRELSKFSRSSYCASSMPDAVALSERWLPQNSHFTVREM